MRRRGKEVKKKEEREDLSRRWDSGWRTSGRWPAVGHGWRRKGDGCGDGFEVFLVWVEGVDEEGRRRR